MSISFNRFCWYFGNFIWHLFLDQNQDLGKCTKEHDETIYQGILSTQIKLVKAFSLTTSAIGIGCQPILLMNMQQQSANIAVMAGAGAFLSFFTLATPILIHHISKKYVTQLNYNKLEDTYTAITYNFFLRKKEVGTYNFEQTCARNISKCE